MLSSLTTVSVAVGKKISPRNATNPRLILVTETTDNNHRSYSTIRSMNGTSGESFAVGTLQVDADNEQQDDVHLLQVRALYTIVGEDDKNGFADSTRSWWW